MGFLLPVLLATGALTCCFFLNKKKSTSTQTSSLKKDDAWRLLQYQTIIAPPVEELPVAAGRRCSKYADWLQEPKSAFKEDALRASAPISFMHNVYSPPMVSGSSFSRTAIASAARVGGNAVVAPSTDQPLMTTVVKRLSEEVPGGKGGNTRGSPDRKRPITPAANGNISSSSKQEGTARGRGGRGGGGRAGPSRKRGKKSSLAIDSQNGVCGLG